MLSKMIIGGLLGLAGTLIGFVLMSHERRLSANAEKAERNSEHIQNLIANQESLQDNLQQRLETGDRYFETQQKQMQSFQETVTDLQGVTQRLEAISKQTQQHLQTLDERIYRQNNKG